MTTNLYRVRPGTHNASDMTSAYAVINWPQAIGQTRRWTNPVSPSGRVSEYDALTGGGLTGTRRAIGRMNFSWTFGFTATGQRAIIRAQILPTNGINEVVTVVTWDDDLGFICVHCNAHWNEQARTGEAFPGVKGRFGIRIDFTDGVIANSGGGFSSGFSSGFNIGGIPA